MSNVTFIKQLELPAVKNGVECGYCGHPIPAERTVSVYTVDDVLTYVHVNEQGDFVDTFLVPKDEDSVKATASLSCPYCGITANPKDGVPFAEAENPSYSLGNHKKWCASKPGSPSRPTAPVAPRSETPPAPAPVVAPVVAPTPAPAKAPVASPATAMPVEYSLSVQRQGDNARNAFISKPVPAHLYWNERVNDEIWPVVLAAYADRQPVLFLGVSGTGKTVFAHALARHFNAHHLGALNFSEDMRMDSLFGNPVPMGQGAIGWNDGIMTRAARWGGIALLEEFTRSGVAATRSMSALDQLERGLYLPENPFEQEVKVHDDFMVLATANPVGLGYTGKDLDAAMRSRFIVVDANFPFADERKVVEPLIGAERADRLVDLFETLRLGAKFYPNTRDLVQVARLLFQKVDFKRAAAVALVSKCSHRHQEGAQLIVDQYSI